MDLRDLKREVHNLARIDENCRKFQESWLKPLHKDTNLHLPFLKELDPETRREVNRKLAAARQQLQVVERGQLAQEKLQQHARQLIELKLTSFRDDHYRADVLKNQLLNDDVLKMSSTVAQISAHEDNVQGLAEHYDDINALLQKKLSLDETLFFLELPHKVYLQNLLRTARQQTALVRNLGLHFVEMVKKGK